MTPIIHISPFSTEAQCTPARENAYGERDEEYAQSQRPRPRDIAHRPGKRAWRVRWVRRLSCSSDAHPGERRERRGNEGRGGAGLSSLAVTRLKLKRPVGVVHSFRPHLELKEAHGQIVVARYFQALRLPCVCVCARAYHKIVCVSVYGGRLSGGSAPCCGRHPT